jgi:hypothetical protein
MSLELGNIVRIFHFDDGNQDLLKTNHPNLWKIVEFRFSKSKSIITPVEWIKNRPFTSQVDMKSRSISSWKLQKVDGRLPE